MKRGLDLVGAALGLALLLPVMALVAAGIGLTMGWPVLFRQVRPGLREKPFTLYKFRTMTDERAPDGGLLPDQARVTRLGTFLRSWSLDELPQLWNVLRGAMSLVGPRPLPLRYLPRYSSRQRLRHAVRPGITGLAQVEGRNTLDWVSRFERDVWYVEHQSLRLDLTILMRTILQVPRRIGVRPGGGGELEEFWGQQGRPTGAPAALPVEANEWAGGAAQ